MEGHKKTSELEFTTLEFHKYYVISTIDEDVNLEHTDVEKLEKLTTEFYKDEPFGYLVNRKNHYSLDPLIYFRVSKITQLVGLAVVVYHSRLKEMTAKFEKRFIDKPFQVHYKMRPAKSWLKNLVKAKKQELSKDFSL